MHSTFVSWNMTGFRLFLAAAGKYNTWSVEREGEHVLPHPMNYLIRTRLPIWGRSHLSWKRMLFSFFQETPSIRILLANRLVFYSPNQKYLVR